MRVSAAHKKSFWKRDDGWGLASCNTRGRTRLTGRQNQGITENRLQSQTRRAGDHKLAIAGAVLSHLVVRGILNKEAAEIGFRSEVAGRDSAIDGVVTAPCGFEWIIALVADVAEARNSHA